MMPNDSAGQGACAAFFSLLFSAAQNGTLLKLILTEPRVPGEKKGIGRLCRMKDGLCLQVETSTRTARPRMKIFPSPIPPFLRRRRHLPPAFRRCFPRVLHARTF